MSTLSDQLGLGASFRAGPSGWGEQTSPFPQGSQGEKFFNSLTSNEDKAAINTYVDRAKQKDPSSDGITGKDGILFALSNNPQYAAQALNYGPPRDSEGNVIPDRFVQGMQADTIRGVAGPSSGSNAFAQIFPYFAAAFLPGIGQAVGNFLMEAGILTTAANASAAVITAGGTAAEAAAAAKTALTIANVAGTTIAKTTAGMAQGQKFEDALKNAVVDAAVSTGSVAIAKDLNKIISDKRVVDALVSAGGSAVKTSISGGTADDIARNMTAALLGSAASSAYQSANEDNTRETGRMIGSGVAGYITNKEIGAITNVLSEYGSQSKGTVASTIKDTFKGTTDTPALPVSQIASLSPDTDAGAATGANELNKVDVTGKATPDITSTNIIDTAARTTATTPPAAELSRVTVTGQRTGDITDTDILNTIAAEKKPDAVLQRVEVRGKALPADITNTDIIDEPAKLQDVTVTGNREQPSALDPVSITGKTDEPAATPEEKPYQPNLFIIGGKKPKAPTKPTSVLSQALGTTTGLTASRGAGEIEDPSTGKKKRKVWNEETLRLKDALGV
jgi:hypothetical protein